MNEPARADAYLISEDAPLDARNTFGVAARAPLLVEVADAGALPTAFADPRLHDRPVLVLGGGSNLLFAGDPDGVVLALTGTGMRVVEKPDDAHAGGREPAEKLPPRRTRPVNHHILPRTAELRLHIGTSQPPSGHDTRGRDCDEQQEGLEQPNGPRDVIDLQNSEHARVGQSVDQRGLRYAEERCLGVSKDRAIKPGQSEDRNCEPNRADDS